MPKIIIKPMNQSRTYLPIASHQALSTIYIGSLRSSPIGPMWVAVSQQGLRMVDWKMSQADFSQQVERRFHTNVVYDESRTADALHQLSEYLDGNLCQFTIPLDLSGMTPFQVQVLRLTSQIPYGKTSTYKEIAVKLGKANAARAVGRVEATNPIPLVIPCHRVLGSDGSLHGYGGPGGIKLKAWLLNLEQSSN
jgi:methylated-DNA-[protein]-cysteine S-methyltransferase